HGEAGLGADPEAFAFQQVAHAHGAPPWVGAGCRVPEGGPRRGPRCRPLVGRRGCGPRRRSGPGRGARPGQGEGVRYPQRSRWSTLFVLADRVPRPARTGPRSGGLGRAAETGPPRRRREVVRGGALARRLPEDEGPPAGWEHGGDE